MEIIVDAKSRIVEIWLSHADQNDGSVKLKLDALCKKYKIEKWVVAVFRSGDEDAAALTAKLVKNNYDVSYNENTTESACKIIALGE